ncbi:MAG TPA: DUF3450 domain-containing protein [Arcobacter sp.]|nr:DUF3450 domain-containing protein [Arcobacter sp.]
MKRNIVVIFGGVSLLVASSNVDKAIDSDKVANATSASIQKHINSLSNKSDSLYEEYINIKKELNEQQSYNKQLKLITDAQNEQIPKLEQQLKDLEQTKKKIIPLMFEMVDTLDKFVQIDTPFLIEERRQRVKNLKSYLSNPDISLSEQYRSIIDSYKIEYNYARTVGVYRAQLDSDDENSPTVDFLRVGRIGFYYQTLDNKKSAMYDVKTHKWVTLDDEYNNRIDKAVSIARKKQAPNFFVLPILKTKDSK